MQDDCRAAHGQFCLLDLIESTKFYNVLIDIFNEISVNGTDLSSKNIKCKEVETTEDLNKLKQIETDEYKKSLPNEEQVYY